MTDTSAPGHVLVTGGAGFIASHIVDAYLERGWRVSVIDDFSTGDRRNLNPRAELFEADLGDPRTAELVSRLSPDVISHQAAQVDVRKSVADPASDAAVNIVASVQLLQKALEAGVRHVIFASSGGAIYGDPLFAPQTEEHPVRPLSPYGCAKLSVEHYLDYFREVHGVMTTAMRYANVYGPRQNTRGEAGVVAIFASRLLRGEDVTINGTGEQTRDYVFVRDVVAANMAVTEQRLGGAFNVGTGVETSVVELQAAIAERIGSTLAPKHGPAKAGEQMRSVLDGSKLRTLAGLGEPVSLREGLAETVDWFKTNA